MMNNDLINRYVYTTTKNLSPKLQHNIATKLHLLIEEMILDRCGDSPPTSNDISIVLTELGFPSKLELEVDHPPSGAKSLISGIYYTKYKIVLLFLLKINLIILTGLWIIKSFLSNTSFISSVFHWIDTTLESSLYLFAIVTILFVIFQRKNVKLDAISCPSRVYELPKEQTKIPGWSVLAWLTFTAVFMIVFFFIPVLRHGEVIPPPYEVIALSKSVLAILIIGFIAIIRETLKLIHGKYVKNLLLSISVMNLISLVLALVWWSNNVLLNTYPNGLFLFDSNTVHVFVKFQLIFMMFFILTLVYDLIDSLIILLRLKRIERKI